MINVRITYGNEFLTDEYECLTARASVPQARYDGPNDFSAPEHVFARCPWWSPAPEEQYVTETKSEAPVGLETE
jgi:hypothetical protein